MAEEKYMHRGGHVLITLGILVFVYGLINYFVVNMGWPAYQAWMVGGVVLVVVGVLKKKMMSGK